MTIKTGPVLVNPILGVQYQLARTDGVVDAMVLACALAAPWADKLGGGDLDKWDGWEWEHPECFYYMEGTLDTWQIDCRARTRYL